MYLLAGGGRGRVGRAAAGGGAVAVAGSSGCGNASPMAWWSVPTACVAIHIVKAPDFSRIWARKKAGVAR